MRAYQAVLPDLRRFNTTLLAISPEPPDSSLTFKEKNELELEVLSDYDNTVAKSYGVSFRLDDAAREVFVSEFGLDLAKRNAAGSWDLPIPATYLVNQDGRIELAFVDPDYTRRLEPQAILDSLARLGT